MAENPLIGLHKQGMSIWLDYLDRKIMDSGHLRKLIDEDGIHGETSNPTIFQMGVSQGTEYAEDIARLSGEGRSAEEICWELMIADVRRACDIFRPLYDESDAAHGYVSLELDPTLADETEPSIVQGRELWKRVDRPNLMIKVPATDAGLPVIRTLLSEGMNVNVTLLFAVRRYEQVMDAFFSGLEARRSAGGAVDRIHSVASFFVSRTDTEVDKRLDGIVAARPEKANAAARIRGRVAVAVSRVAYHAFEEHFNSERWRRLAAAGARLQRPLWASTGTKNPAYSDILYVQDLIGPHCVNTVPEKTMNAFRDHGVAKRTLTDENRKDAEETLALISEAGVDIREVTERVLVREGVEKFKVSYRDLLKTIAEAAGRAD
ncbi:MAG: transaldolase [Candidatus Eisenbacteria bacterium]|nr:transaldolase [Candidatus Eisenbacteria bacterium]